MRKLSETEIKNAVDNTIKKFLEGSAGQHLKNIHGPSLVQDIAKISGFIVSETLKELLAKQD